MPVYLIANDDGAGHVKIGWSEDPAARVRQLQTGSPTKLKLLDTIDGPPELEKQLHEMLAAWRLEGEWFDRAGVGPIVDLARKAEEPHGDWSGRGDGQHGFSIWLTTSDGCRWRVERLRRLDQLLWRIGFRGLCGRFRPPNMLMDFKGSLVVDYCGEGPGPDADVPALANTIWDRLGGQIAFYSDSVTTGSVEIEQGYWHLTKEDLEAAAEGGAR